MWNRVLFLLVLCFGLSATLLNAQPPPEPAGPVKFDIKVNSKDGLRYVYIPPGTFRMGCSSGDGACDGDEKPPHDVRITKGFWMGETDVTVEAYKKYVRATGKAMPDEPVYGKKLNPNWSNESVPMTMVSWTEAGEYCEWSGKLRLPTEAQWEYAARAGTTGPRYGELDEIAWWSGNSGGRARASPHDVAQKRPNAFKLYDMLGNVLQWTADWYRNGYESDGLETDPQGPPGGEYHVLRGGSCFNVATDVRVSGRVRNRPADRFDDFGFGFRCAGEIAVP